MEISAGGRAEFNGGGYALTGLNATSTGTMEFSAGSASLSSGTALGGTVNFSGAGISVYDDNSAPGDVHLSAGSIGDTGSLTVGDVTWTGGSIIDDAVVVISPGGTLTIEGDETKQFSARYVWTQYTKSYPTLRNEGGATVTGAGDLTCVGVPSGYSDSAHGKLQNAETFDIQSDAGFTENSYGFGTIENSGEFSKSGGSGTSGVSWAFTNTGTVEAASGTLSFSDTFTQTAGATVLAGGSIQTSSSLRIEGGTLSGSGLVVGGVNNTGGVVAPGASAGLLQISGAYSQSASAGLVIELGGTVRGDEYDALDVGGSLSPGGTLQVELIGEFAPETGNTFHILNWDTLTGSTFNAVELPELTGRKAWDTSDLYDTGEISVIGMLDGDTDTDWDVDSVDLANFVAVFGTDGDRYTDFNEDGRVDLADFVLQRANFGAGAGAPEANDETIATPEPATMVILGLGVLGLMRRRRRR